MSEVRQNRESQVQTPRPELIFGLVGPIGCNVHAVELALSAALKSVDYVPETISLSDTIADLIALKSKTRPVLKTLEEKINAGNDVRTIYEANGILAIGAIRSIKAARNRVHSLRHNTIDKEDPPICEGAAYIIRQFKRREETELLENIYGRQFIQVSITQDEPSRYAELCNRTRTDCPGFSDQQIEDKARELMSRDINEGSSPSGQRVEEIFHRGDVFIDASTPEQIEKTTRRFIDAIFGRTNIAPSMAEHGSYLAKAASLRSVDLSRQVGAAILSNEGDLISIGCNEVPKPKGGNYWDEDQPKSRDVDRTGESNKDERNRIIFDFLRLLKNKGLLSEDPETLLVDAELQREIDSSLIGEITEYGRMVHAEMNAISDAARLGRSVRGATIYVTTFPCHNCAKHLIASGIQKIVFVEPYPKSRTLTLYSDAITTNGEIDKKVEIKHFSGISPRRFRDIFEKGKRRDKSGKIMEWIKGRPFPQVPIRELDYRQAEDAAIRNNLEKLA